MVQSVVWGIGMCWMAVVHRGSVWCSELCGNRNVSGGSGCVSCIGGEYGAVSCAREGDVSGGSVGVCRA